MTTIDPQRIAAVRSDYGHCFGCGLDNPHGLQVDGFEVDGTTVTARFRPQPGHRGFHDILHGGIVATALDEILAWTGILVAGTMAVTAKMEMKFRNPAPADTDYDLWGNLVEQRGKRLILEARCTSAGKTIAEATALFLATEAIPDPAVE